MVRKPNQGSLGPSGNTGNNARPPASPQARPPAGKGAQPAQPPRPKTATGSGGGGKNPPGNPKALAPGAPAPRPSSGNPGQGSEKPSTEVARVSKGSASADRGNKKKKHGTPQDVEGLLGKVHESRELTPEEKDDLKTEESNRKAKRLLKIFGVVLLVLILILVLVFRPKTVKEEKQPANALKSYESCLDSYDTSCAGDYISKEKDYANGNKSKEDFIKAVTSTVKFHPKMVQKEGFAGRKLKDDEGNPVMVPDTMVDDHSAYIEYVDWENLPISPAEWGSVMKNHPDFPDNKDQSGEAEDMFAEYVTLLKKGNNLPTKVSTINADFDFDDDDIPMVSESTKTEIDKELFSGGNINLAMDRYSYSLKSKDPKKRTLDEVDPVQITILEDGNPGIEGKIVGGQKLENKTLEGLEKSRDPSNIFGQDDDMITNPYEKLDVRKRDYYMEHTWVGAYENEQKGIPAPQGDGTKENTLGAMTWGKTVAKDSKSGNIFPVKMRAVESKKDQEAIDLFESRDERNRGVSLEQGMKFMYVKAEVKNLDKKAHTFDEQWALANSNGSVTNRSGNIYGLKSQVTLKAGEKTEIEGWVGSPTMEDNFLIWGRDFSTKPEILWFRVLQGSEGKVEKSADEGSSDAPSDGGSESPADGGTGASDASGGDSSGS